MSCLVSNNWLTVVNQLWLRSDSNPLSLWSQSWGPQRHPVPRSCLHRPDTWGLEQTPPSSPPAGRTWRTTSDRLLAAKRILNIFKLICGCLWEGHETGEVQLISRISVGQTYHGEEMHRVVQYHQFGTRPRSIDRTVQEWHSSFHLQLPSHMVHHLANLKFTHGLMMMQSQRKANTLTYRKSPALCSFHRCCTQRPHQLLQKKQTNSESHRFEGKAEENRRQWSNSVTQQQIYFGLQWHL